MAAAALTVGCLGLGAGASYACAQSGDPLVPGRIEVGAGARWAGRTSFVARDATETASGPASVPFVLFSSASALDAAAGAEAHVAVRLMRLIQAEIGGSYSRPTLRASIGADAEKAAPTEATEVIQQVTIDGSLVVHIARWRLKGRGVPFVIAGAGYLRQLHEGRTVVQDGQTYHAGAGIRIALRSRTDTRLKGIGFRTDVRALVCRNGIALDGRAHVTPVLRASLFVGF
jgi:hypothetical protein